MFTAAVNFLALSAFVAGQTQAVQPSQSLLNLQATFTQDLPLANLNGAIPGVVMAFGDRAVVLASAKDGKSTRPAVVAAEYGKGKVAAYGHGSLLEANLHHPMNSKLFKWLYTSGRPIGWMAKGPFSVPGLDRVKAERFELGQLKVAMRECSVLVVGMDVLRSSPGAVNDLQNYVYEGGAILITDTPWGWLQLNPRKSIRADHPGQKLLATMGIGFADGMLDSTEGKFKLEPALPEHNAKTALAIFESGETVSKESAGVLSNTLISAVSDCQVDSEFGKYVREAVSKQGATRYPVKGKPIGTEDFRARIGAAVFDLEWRSIPLDQVKAHPVSTDFPGAVGENEVRKSIIVAIGGGQRKWWSTGCYAPPGEKIQLRVGSAFGASRLGLRIGGHKDTLWHLDSWQRFPSITLEIPVVNGVAEAVNPFGGMVYVTCESPIPRASVTINGGVESPTFFIGRTTESDWKRLRSVDVPWGEIVGEQSAICVPSSVLKSLEKPADVARYWDEMVREAEKFYAVAPGTTEHRYQVDRQISAGYMHAGYPIMTWEDVSQRFVDLSVLRGKEGNPNWGFYHELGHNYQRPEWTWSGWGEVTNNLFSVFGCLHFNGNLEGHGSMTPAQVTERLNSVKSKPGAEKYYQKDPWYGLTFWMEIHRDFGFEPMTKLFSYFESLPPAQRPKTDQERRDAFLVQMSGLVGRDLSRYCQMWGVGCSKEAEAQVAVYREWLPRAWR